MSELKPFCLPCDSIGPEIAVDQVVDNLNYWTRDLAGSAGTVDLGSCVDKPVCSIAQASAIRS